MTRSVIRKMLGAGSGCDTKMLKLISELSAALGFLSLPSSDITTSMNQIGIAKGWFANWRRHIIVSCARCCGSIGGCAAA